uniref:Ig-like domain-containing protein n=1 Tax=Denticeps clupeoides TaxID=299321 RepID=A0AAY4A009_9TELE
SDLFYAAESDPISIECKTYIKGGIYEWLHNNQKILTIKSNDLVRALGNLLKISNLQKGDSGQFVCKVPGHPDDVHTLHVISVSASPSGAWLLSAPAELRCETGQSSEAKTEWLKNNEIVHSEGVKTIKSVARSDEGRWTCKITTEDKRIFTKTLDITNVTARLGNSATLPCSLTPPNLGSLRVVGGGWKQMSGAQRKLCLPTLNASAGLHWTAEETHSDCEPRVKGLKGALSTNFSVTLLNTPNQTNPSKMCVITVLLTDKANQFWLHWKIWTWVGVGVLAFVIILLVVVLCCLRNKRMKVR